MQRHLPVPLARLTALGLLLLLGACAQQREPGYYSVAHGDTVSDARHQAQGHTEVVAPSQLQLGFGGTQNAQTTQATPGAGSTSASPDGSASQAGSSAATKSTPSRGALPKDLTETRTYLGTVACTDGGQCPATRMVVTLAPDGQWRARTTPIGGTAQTLLGCWSLGGVTPTRVVLRSGEQSWATLEFIQSNVLRLMRLNGQAPLLESRLTRQADIDPIDELAAKGAQHCPAP